MEIMIKKQKEKMMEWFRRKRNIAIGTALLFLALGTGIYASLLSTFAVEQHAKEEVKPTKPLPNDILNIIAKQIEDRKEHEYIPVELDTWEPAASYLNLSTRFPEGADTSDPTQSHAGMIFKELLRIDGEWYSQVIAHLDDKPEQMAALLGMPVTAVYGKYNVTDQEQDPFNKETWTVKKWDDVIVTISDANGSKLETNSNLKEIMAMANVYGYYHNWEDEELFLNYAKQLLEKSRNHAFSMSDISFEKEILTQEDIAKARSKGNGQALADYFKPPSSTASGENTSEQADSTSTASGENASEQAKSTSASAGENASVQVESTDFFQTDAADTGISVTKAMEWTLRETGFDGGPGVVKATPSEATAFSGSDASNENGAVSHESKDAADSVNSAIAEFETDTDGNVIFPTKTGELDLHLNLTVYKLSGSRNLYSIDEIGNSTENFNENWQGWTPDKIAAVNELVNENWYAKFGISSNSFSTAATLTDREIDAYLSNLPADLSETRRAVIEKALNTVGYIPYYFGGKPVSEEFDSNHFYKIIAPDDKGRVFRGLDCSGWVNYILWSATGKRPYAASTGAFIHAGRAVDRADLKPGDVLVRSGTEETVGHIVMFLQWNPDGSMKVIEETGFPQNNVTISDTNITWACRNLLD